MPLKLSQVLLSVFSISLVFFSLSSCSSSEALKEPSPIKIGFVSWPGYDIIYYAQAKDMFAKYDLDVELIHYPTREAEFSALKNSEVDALMTTSWDALKMSGKSSYNVILITDVSSGSDGIVSTKGVKSFEELKGKRVSVEKDSVDELVLLEALQHHHMDFSDVEVIDIVNNKSLSKLYHNEIEAAVLWEPLLSKTKRKIEGNLLFTTKEIDSSVIDLLMVRSASLKQNKAAWEKFIYVWFDLMDLLGKNPDDVFDIVSKKIGSPFFRNDYSGLKTGDLLLNQEMFAQERLKESINKIGTLILPENKVKININSQFTIKAMQNWQKNNRAE